MRLFRFLYLRPSPFGGVYARIGSRGRLRHFNVRKGWL